jgi:hypothetical protein
MNPPDPRHDLTQLAALEALFEPVKEVSILKEIDHVDVNYAAWIAASPFLVLGTAHVLPGAVPTPGKILADISGQRIDAAQYDRELPGRVKTTLY